MHWLSRYIVFSAIALAPWTTDAVADNHQTSSSNFYVGVMGGLAAFDGIEGADYEFGFAASGFAGLDIWQNWRGEAELLYEAAEFENSADETSLFKVSGSLYTDFGANWREGLAFYAGGGAGIVLIDVGNDTNNTDLSGHVEGGISVPMTDRLYLVPGIRLEYIILDDIDDQVIAQFRAALRLGL